MEQRRQRKRALAIVLALIASVVLVASVFADSWLASPSWGEDVHIGLRSFTRCKQERCVSITNPVLMDVLDHDIELIKQKNRELPAGRQLTVPHPPWHGFPVVGMITFVASLIAAAGLTTGAVLALARQRRALPIMPTTVAVLALAIAIICGCIFVATKPEIFNYESLLAPHAPLEDIIVGWSFILFGGGAVTGLAAVFPLNRQIRPIDVELGEAASTMSWGASRDDA